MTTGFAMLQELQEELTQLGCGREDFDWAVAVLHSRCFVEGPNRTHMVVPGVDMANHSFTPNAAVRFIAVATVPDAPPCSCVVFRSCKLWVLALQADTPVHKNIRQGKHT